MSTHFNYSRVENDLWETIFSKYTWPKVYVYIFTGKIHVEIHRVLYN